MEECMPAPYEQTESSLIVREIQAKSIISVSKM